MSVRNTEVPRRKLELETKKKLSKKEVLRARIEESKE